MPQCRYRSSGEIAEELFQRQHSRQVVRIVGADRHAGSAHGRAIHQWNFEGDGAYQRFYSNKDLPVKKRLPTPFLYVISRQVLIDYSKEAKKTHDYIPIGNRIRRLKSLVDRSLYQDAWHLLKGTIVG